jgi:inositol oxygenase
MAPSAVNTENEDTIQGRQLEETSDNIDAVNVLKARLKGKSHENAGKDESQFRLYEEACDRVKDFYREQHEKQTVAFNLKASTAYKATSLSRTNAVLDITGSQ